MAETRIHRYFKAFLKLFSYSLSSVCLNLVLIWKTKCASLEFPESYGCKCKNTSGSQPCFTGFSMLPGDGTKTQFDLSIPCYRWHPLCWCLSRLFSPRVSPAREVEEKEFAVHSQEEANRDHQPWPHLTSLLLLCSRESNSYCILCNTDAMGFLLQYEANSHFLKLLKNRVIFVLHCFYHYIWSESRILPMIIWQYHNIALL